jgi:hypothetical protein
MFAVRCDNYLHYSREGVVNTKSTFGDDRIWNASKLMSRVFPEKAFGKHVNLLVFPSCASQFVFLGWGKSSALVQSQVD